MANEQKQQLQRLYDSHKDYRKTLARLPFEEKMKILIQMQRDFAAFHPDSVCIWEEVADQEEKKR